MRTRKPAPPEPTAQPRERVRTFDDYEENMRGQSDDVDGLPLDEAIERIFRR